MLYEVTGNILSGEYNIICHQVNCQGIMGAGLAKQIKEKYPEAYNSYKETVTINKCNKYPSNKLLGTIDFCRISDGEHTIVNMFAQDYYGTDKKYTSYIAFKICLTRLANMLKNAPADMKVAFPYKISCGLAGGNWKIINAMIKDFAEYVVQPVYIIRLPE